MRLQCLCGQSYRRYTTVRRCFVILCVYVLRTLPIQLVSPFCIQVKHCATAHHSKFVAENADAYQVFLVQQKKELLEFRLQSIRAKQRASYGEVSAPIAIPRCMVYNPVVSYMKDTAPFAHIKHNWRGVLLMIFLPQQLTPQLVSPHLSSSILTGVSASGSIGNNFVQPTYVPLITAHATAVKSTCLAFSSSFNSSVSTSQSATLPSTGTTQNPKFVSSAVYIACACGVPYIQRYRQRHFRSSNHIRYLCNAAVMIASSPSGVSLLGEVTPADDISSVSTSLTSAPAAHSALLTAVSASDLSGHSDAVLAKVGLNEFDMASLSTTTNDSEQLPLPPVEFFTSQPLNVTPNEAIFASLQQQKQHQHQQLQTFDRRKTLATASIKPHRLDRAECSCGIIYQ